MSLAHERADDKVFYGWWIVGASFVALLVTVGVGLYAPPVFLVPLQDQFGWSRAAIAGGSAMSAVMVGIISPLAGVWIDRYGSRKVMTAGALVMAAAFALLGLVTSLWQLYALNLTAALGMACVAWIPNQTLISNWFNRKRGLAMGIAVAGIGFGGLAMAPLAGLLIDRFGWRLAFAGLASLIFFIVIPATLALIRSRPADLGLLPDGDLPLSRSAGSTINGEGQAQAVPGLTLSDSVRSSAFWVLSLSQCLWIFGSMSVIGHLVAYLRDVGFESGVAASSLGIALGISVVGRLLFGYFADRFTKKSIMVVPLLLHGASVLCLLGIQSPGALPAFVTLFGLGLGGGAVLIPLLVGECFGLLSFGKILGMVMISATLGAAVGPVLTGWIYDVTGAYQFAFLLHIAAFATAAVVISLLRRPQGMVAPAVTSEPLATAGDRGGEAT
jgi:MFS family permease